MRRTGTNITFWGTIGTAGILIWGLSQGQAKPDYSPTYLQIQPPPPTKSVAVHAASRPQRALVKSTPARKRIHLVRDATIKTLCKLRKYAALEPQQPAYQLASKEDVDVTQSPAGLKVTPEIRDIMNVVRPKQIAGVMEVEGKQYEFGSGGRGQSIPYGDYLITPDAIGSWGSKHGAIGVADGTIPDPKLHRDRDGIELHAATNDKLETDGCVSIRKDQWPEFREQVLTMVREDKKVYLHVSEQGASVSTNPSGFIGEAISGPTLQDVQSLIDGPVHDEPDRCCGTTRIKARHRHEGVRAARFHGRAVRRRRA